MATKKQYRYVGKVMDFNELPIGSEFVCVNFEPINAGYEGTKVSEGRWLREGWRASQACLLPPYIKVIRVVKVERSDDPFENFRLNGGHIVD